jgi:protein SCO1
MQKRQLLGGLGLVALLALGACGQDKPAFRGVDITGAEYAQGWELADQNGQVRTVKDFAGKVVIVFFGYTQCPDVCPTSMQELAEVKRMLGKDGERLQGVFITVDPDRDTSELLKSYMANFDPSFVALRASTPEQLAKVTKDFKIYYKKVDGKTPTSYTMDHSAGSYTFDPQGRVRLYNRYGSGAAALAEDVKILLK